MGIIEEVEEKLAALKLRLPELEGKANKKERTQVNKEIYNLENDEEYIKALKERREGARAEEAKADDAAHAEKLRQEEMATEELRQAASKAAEERAAAVTAEDATDDEVHMEIKQLKKGDEETKPEVGDKVAITYTGRFAEGTSYEGVEYGGKEFDTSIQTSGKGNKKTKTQVPLAFKLGEGKAIRGWEECVKTMTLGEKLEVTIGPKWAYRKGGLQDDSGKYLVPPNATLVFEMRLVQVRDVTVDPNA
mmetsp:Transcript_1929/g.3914  ORF Transcript_1929/g.3914 Transcript_1929/m.3914 type:complete len:249 (-) Transcript_1929:321-1067(-)|eukprot:CAMPEP_0174737252 /NCGR_PEP_ID=MMETSP1094-20130205/68031_1 /TAXON_ID=156173 /ORGANISM="Chrysochromulina brevifilum, Strain UTEX LB 985" /LENGTH=248 /DNA_ID=CAMNT_0015940459 /DNA_START=21 /DNA_END=767 /DNA_ORIENTATION=+